LGKLPEDNIDNIMGMEYE
jgi:ABC-type antimicrobial peptide transport system permease subunit